jgi:CubicO group peptidase (beta-lactamase class C family)
VEQGSVELDAPVRRYIPEFDLKDESAAGSVTVLQLFNHTAGWEGDFDPDTGEGDDAVARYVAEMATIEQITPPGEAVSYNNASLVVAGRIIEKVTGKTYEAALEDLVLGPVGLYNTHLFMNDIMTRRFAVGHIKKLDGSIVVARPWAMHRGGAPAGGISSDAGDQIKWARFHLGDGHNSEGDRVLSNELLGLMKMPTAEMPGSSLGDAVGISWLIRKVDGATVVGHGGATIGQFSAFEMVPDRDFALVSMTNCGPNGAQFDDALIKWAFETYLGLQAAEPQPIDRPEQELAEYEGLYTTIEYRYSIKVESGRLEVKADPQPEAVALWLAAGSEEPEDEPTYPIGMLADEDRYVVTGGPDEGGLGFFVRDASGSVTGFHVGGRLAPRAR